MASRKDIIITVTIMMTSMLAGLTTAEVYSSTAELRNVLLMERKVIDRLNTFVNQMESKLDKIKRYASPPIQKKLRVKRWLNDRGFGRNCHGILSMGFGFKRDTCPKIHLRDFLQEEIPDG